MILGFLLGSWLLTDGLHRLITGDFLRLHGQLGPWAQLVARVGLDPMRLGLPIALFGVLWMLVPNLYLFQNRPRAWVAMLLLIVASGWYLGAATVLLLAQLVLLLLPATRRGLARTQPAAN
ncbi:MAG: hypothetical protein ACRD1E_08605 [Terriglobales bacterium]